MERENNEFVDKEFLLAEFSFINDHLDVIHSSRDRFFSQFLTVAIALYGIISLGMKDGGTSMFQIEISSIFFVLLIVVVTLFGIGVLFIIAANGLARDFYRQRKGIMIKLLMQLPKVEVSEFKKEYLEFSRDKTAWSYRPLSIYTIYSVIISAINGINLIVVAYVLGLDLSNDIAAIVVLGLVVLQQFCSLEYIRYYVKRPYKEGIRRKIVDQEKPSEKQ